MDDELDLVVDAFRHSVCYPPPADEAKDPVEVLAHRGEKPGARGQAPAGTRGDSHGT